jgi:hypothetical protein
MISKTAGPGLWCDTSETLTLAHYQFLAKAGYRGCFRYIPRSSQGDPNQGPPISLQELQLALSVKCPDGTGFALQFVQYARSNSIDASHGTLDGQVAAAYMKTLGVPHDVCVWQDLAYATKQLCIDYSNASYAAMMTGGIAAAAPGMYAEPGYPLTADERYSLLNLHRYWSTAANDPNKNVAHRGCQVLQLWESSQGQFFPEPGLVIDADAIQSDYYNSFPVAVVAAP